MHVQYGCGWSSPVPLGWRHFDASPTLRFERIPLIGKLYTKNSTPFPPNVEYGDIIKGLPIPDSSCVAIYCSHVLEHLSRADCRLAIQNTYRALRPEGIFRLVMPDLEYCARQYVESDSPDAAHEFMHETSLGQEHRPRSLRGIIAAWLGNSQHLWMWDIRSMRSELEAAGFVDVRRASFGDSPDTMFSQVEQRVRWEQCLGIECRKPE